ncbi:unnamed protein product [Lathyrus oleraceus]
MLLTRWIISQFPRIIGFEVVSAYTENLSRAATFIPLRGNKAVEPFKVHFYRLVTYKICFCPYRDHREMCPFDIISLYSERMACGLGLMFPYLPERVMRQFDYLHIIPRHPLEFALPIFCHIDLDAILDNFESHLILEEYYMVLSYVQWGYVDGYMTLDAPRIPHMPSNYAVLEAQDDHTRA